MAKMVNSLASQRLTEGFIPHILIVDDEFSNRMLLQRLLMHGNRLTEAEDGRQTLALLQQETFDLVLLDIMMPDISGLDVLQQIRATPEIADLPVILISALNENDNIVHGLQIGANDYIVKPFDIDVISARVETQLQLKKTMDIQKQAIAELEAAQNLKDRLFRIASHDLKSPLANVNLAERLLRQMINEDPTAIEILDQVKATVLQMNKVIEDFLDMAACQSGNIEINLAPVEVQSTIADVLNQYHMTAVEKDIVLGTGTLPGMIYADQPRVAQVLSNLVSNAIKYSPPGTTVSIWSEVINDRVRINIADEGPGIPVEERSRLFTEFGKLSNRPTGNESSTGLGLWIVKHMVTLQHGTIDVDCPSDGGSIFWVEFPTA